MPEWFPTVLSTINELCKTKFTRSKYRITHVILKITGIKLSNLKFVTISELKRLFNKEDMYIQSLKGEQYKHIYIPWVPAMEKYLALVKKDLFFLEKCLKEGYKKIFKTNYDYNNPTEILKSEIWGNLNRSTFTREINKQLKFIGLKLKDPVKLTSNSYRRGFAVLIGKMFGESEIKLILNYSSESSLQIYLTNKFNKKLIKKIFQQVLSIENSRKVNYNILE